MGNLLITSKCNRKCSFCFARQRLNSRNEPSNITRENIRKVMDFSSRSGTKQLRLLGGEPSVHPEFTDILDEAISDGFHVHVFTNGMFSAGVTDYIEQMSDSEISFLCNISPQAKDSEKQIRDRTYALKKLGQKITLSITLTSPDFEFDYLIDIIKEYNLRKHIRVGIAQPIVGQENDYLHPDDYRETGRAIMNMTNACIAEDILIGFDCGMTLCMFSEAELGQLQTRTEGFKSVCNPIVDIGLDLSVWSCFPLSDILNSHLDSFDNRMEITAFYEKELAPYRTLGCKSECLTCDFKRRGQCFGGCLAHAINSLSKKPPRESGKMKK
ncbi:hypothetical protein MTBBW1_50055 [Desulfamplus magnetovallimortis]|uniref:Radical SAM core domain-containing protein n=1 Tax=Desulfamplus magnetovallimortis TaxID=1246637 RepID=A0A1W1HHT0_9BACT|nr:radical SAM protein [Desulfamplus magnetovallimortis]SLM31932.1 hypothetical protein MTBBW1_50055 [Desulfamplus magnetovallimortis]